MKKIKIATIFVASVFLFAKYFIINSDSNKFRYLPTNALYNGKPYTGLTIAFHNGLWRPRKIQFFYKGRQQFKELHWFYNFRLRQITNYRDGLREGTTSIWFDDGSIQALRNYVRDKAHGEYYGWHRNGVLSDFHYFENGKQIVYRAFISDGKPYYNYVYRGEEMIGVKGGEFCKVKTN
ncbi:MAG: hypothetical protein VX642_14010 [Bdellovibrionota bacterium]|nr:hypothetical protein [Bdellovibrionota bacterium]